MALSTSWSLDPRAPSTASNPVVVCVNAVCDCVFTIHTHISNPHASAMPAAVTKVDNAC